MTDKPQDRNKGRTEATEKQRSEREARLAEALRANLRRRKAQERGRSRPPAETGDKGGDAPEEDRG